MFYPVYQTEGLIYKSVLIWDILTVILVLFRYRITLMHDADNALFESNTLQYNTSYRMNQEIPYEV